MASNMATMSAKEVNVSERPLGSSNGSHDSINRLERRNSDEKLSAMEKWWLWEFSAWFICFAALIGMVGFLIPMNQKPVPAWVLSQSWKGYTVGFSVSINAILSIFSTIVKSMILIPVAAAIGQLKWNWYFADGHQLADFTRFEAAGRGPLGAILLIWRMKGRSLVCLGAAIVIGSLALDFSFQQMVTYPPEPRNVSVAYMPATPTYSAYSLTAPSAIAQIQFQQPDGKMQTAMKIGMEGLDTTVSIEPTCITGNCTWTNTVASIAVCSACYDSTADLTPTNCVAANEANGTKATCDYTLPNGFTINGTADSLGYSSMFKVETADPYSPINSSYFEHIKSPIAVMSTAGFTHSTTLTTGDVFSNQCALFWCIQKFNVSIVQGNYTSKLVDTFTANGTEATAGTGDLDIEVPASFMADTGHNGSATFKVTFNASNALRYYTFTNSQMAGEITEDPLLHTFGRNGFMNYLWPLSTEELTQAWIYLAGNMTNAIRMSTPLSAAASLTGSAGKTLQNVAKVNVVWWWLFLPGTMLLLSLAFLIATVIASRKQGVMLWKTSALASFYHPLAQDGREKLQKAQGLKELEKLAEEVQVKGEMTEKGYRLIQNQDGVESHEQRHP